MDFFYAHPTAWIKRYFQETGTDRLQELFDDGEVMACSPLGLLEVLARVADYPQVDRARREEKATEATVDWGHFLQIQLTDETLSLAGRLLERFPVSGPDALHLGSALLLKRRFVEDADRLLFISTDRRLTEAATQSGLTFLNPEVPD